MRKLAVILVGLLTFTLFLAGCGSNPAPTTQSASKEIYVSAAASLRDALTEIQKNYQQKNSNIKLIYNFGGSGSLQRQIEQGAPADIFFSAGKSQMDALEKENLLVKATRKDLVGNVLVLVVPKAQSKVANLQDLTKTDVVKVGIGSPDSVPAGKYAQEAMNSLHLWNDVKPKLVFTEDVSQVLRYVETGNVDAGVVYQSDAQSSDKVKVVTSFPANSHSPIVYPAAVLNTSKNQKEANDFFNYLTSPEAQKVFEKYGFKTMS